MGNAITGTVLKIEQIGFHQYMHIEGRYQTAVLRFGYFEILTNWKNNHRRNIFENSEKIFQFSKNLKNM